jgi:Protein of unknown function (DUF2628)
MTQLHASPDPSAAPHTGTHFCSTCGAQAGNSAAFCSKCGGSLSGTAPARQQQLSAGVAGTAPAAESPYYAQQFASFDANGGRFRATFNVWAFLLGPLWYFSKGMNGKAVIMLLISLLGITGPPIWVYCGIYGNYDYYRYRKQST